MVYIYRLWCVYIYIYIYYGVYIYNVYNGDTTWGYKSHLPKWMFPKMVAPQNHGFQYKKLSNFP